MHRIFRKDQVLTIPNLLSVIRLALIPLIVWLYIGKQECSAAVAVILISGATDIIDGFIARKFNMVSDLGKILDPVADKLTQATVILCLTVKYRWMRGLIVLFVVKEIIMAVLGYMAIQKKDVVNSAKWYGKLNTVVLYLVMTCLILFPSISETVANVLNLHLRYAYVPYAVHTVLPESVPHELNQQTTDPRRDKMVVVYILLGILAVLLLYICFLAICSLCVDPKKEYEKNSRFYRTLLTALLPLL